MFLLQQRFRLFEVTLKRLPKIIIKILKRGKPTDVNLKNMVIVKIKQAIPLCTKRGLRMAFRGNGLLP